MSSDGSVKMTRFNTREDQVTCPTCEKSFGDLWDYEWDHRESIEIECPHCDAPLTLRGVVSIDYSVSKREISR